MRDPNEWLFPAFTDHNRYDRSLISRNTGSLHLLETRTPVSNVFATVELAADMRIFVESILFFFTSRFLNRRLRSSFAVNTGAVNTGAVNTEAVNTD